jgi:hypothetical protein
VLRGRIEADLARMPPAADPTNASGRHGQWKLVNACADLADASGDVDVICSRSSASAHAFATRPEWRGGAGLAYRARGPICCRSGIST